MTEKDLEQTEWIIGYLSEGQASLTGEEVLMLHKLIAYVKQQAERVQELEILKVAFVDLDSDFIDLQKQNKRYREALEEITTRKMSTFLTTRDMSIHFIKTARKALEESE